MAPGAGGAHGVEPAWQTNPTELLPFGIPFTDQVTLVSDVFVTAAINERRCIGASMADGGDTVTLT
jgi:hypothetical protein